MSRSVSRGGPGDTSIYSHTHTHLLLLRMTAPLPPEAGFAHFRKTFHYLSLPPADESDASPDGSVSNAGHNRERKG